MAVNEPLCYRNIRFEPEQIVLLDGGRPQVFVPKDSVKRVVLKAGILSKHPYVQSAFGVLLLVPGLAVLRVIYIWLTHGGVLVDKLAMSAVCLPLGIWLMVTAFKRGAYLEVEREGQQVRLTLNGEVSPDEAHALVGQVRERFGYEIISDL